MTDKFLDHLKATLRGIADEGLVKRERLITGAQGVGAIVFDQGHGAVHDRAFNGSDFHGNVHHFAGLVSRFFGRDFHFRFKTLPIDLHVREAKAVRRTTEVDVAGWREACSGLPLSHMGRGPDEDPWFFAAAYAAGRLAGSLIS